MRRSRVVLSIAAVLVLSAGLVVGRLLPTRPGPAGGHGGGGGRGWFNDALDLTPEQRKQMDGIWADTKQQIARTWDRRHDLDRKREAAVRALLTPAQVAAYDKAWADYHAGRTALDQERDRLVHDADDRSQLLLTDSQKARWKAMSKDMHDHHGGPGGPPSGPPPGPPPPPPSGGS